MRCCFVPPFLLRRLARCPAPELRGYARHTLELDGIHRSVRASGRLGHATEPDELRRTIYDAHHTTTLPGKAVRGEGDPPTGDVAVDEAYAWLGASYTCYREAYGRNSIDGAGMPLEASVHYGHSYDNAFWTGEQLVYGDGDGEVFRRFTAPIGVTAHEFTHGVVEHTAELAYTGQTGALNESVSDVFASLVKQYTNGETAAQADWLVGEGIFQPRINGVALRSLAAPGTAYDDPLIGSDPQPATMAGYVETSEDNGGVHINSGIPNHAFYLAAATLGGYAWEGVGRVWYDALTAGALPPDADFTTFARVTTAAADRRFGEGSGQARAVRRGWSEVGLPA